MDAAVAGRPATVPDAGADPGRDGVDPARADAAAPTGAAAARPPRIIRWPGLVALSAGLLTPALVTAGILIGQDDAFLIAWWVALAAVGTSLLAVVAGIAAAVGGWGRVLGIAAILLGVAANPIVLVWALDLLGGL